ncbi:MAG: Flp pilus assembly complex ATPase component TadA [Ruminococcus sp.]|nr:Flp pilus assembly complex ATPase component TadA [Ruminococcus sp.]
MNEISKLDYAIDLISPSLKSALMRVSEGERQKLTELRLRRGLYLTGVLYGKEYFITYDGRLMNDASDAVRVTDDDISFAFTHAFQGSVHAFPREISQGFITVKGGNRVGFCGTAVLDDKTLSVASVKDVSSINIRIAREVRGCAKPIFERAFSDGLASLIIASPPCGGKTTVLRDLCRLLSQSYRLSVIDERGELACMYDGKAQNDIGARCDVFNGYDKSQAVRTAVRVMSPQIIVCDEIGAKEDLESLEYAINSGVYLICTCHAASVDELKKRPAVGRLIKSHAFDYAAILGIGAMCGRLISFSKLC